jgi:inner membrane protein YidH
VTLHSGARAAEPPKADTPLDASTDLAFERSRLASERTLMAWIRTSLSMISFGFTIFKFFEYLGATPGSGGLRHGPLNLGRVMVVLGVLLLVPAIIQHWQFLRELRERAHRRFPPSLALVTAGLIQLIGIVALLSLFLRLGPF